MLDSATAFHAVDRAGGLAERLYPPAATPPPPLTLVEAHARMAAAVDALCAHSVVVMATAAAAVLFEESGLECKAALPPAWEVRGRLSPRRSRSAARPCFRRSSHKLPCTCGDCGAADRAAESHRPP